MWASEVATEIGRPPADVYRYLADFTRHREWSSARLESLEPLTGGPLRAGSEFRAQETAPGRVVTMSRVTALEPGRRIAWHSWWLDRMAVDWEFRLAPSPGGTRLVQASRWQPGSPLMAAFHRLVRRRQIPHENERSLERIRQLLEAGEHAAAS